MENKKGTSNVMSLYFLNECFLALTLCQEFTDVFSNDIEF